MNIIRSLAIRFGLASAPTVASIMSGFTKTISQLDAHAEACDEKSAAIHDQIIALEMVQQDVIDEHTSALITAKKLRSLIE